MAEKWGGIAGKRKALDFQGLFTVTGGEWGIRTPDRLWTYTRFPVVLLKPLGQLSRGAILQSRDLKD